jgi:hypothetical protein
MSYLTAKQLTIADSANLDAFSRLRVSDPTGLFNSQLEYGKEALIWDELTAGAGASAHDADGSCVDMTVTTASGDKVRRQSLEYIRYQPGKSQLIFMTFVLGAASTNCEVEVGLGDDNNGLFLRREGSNYFFTVRSNVTGSVVDTDVAQASWDDPMDGTGASGITLDFTKSQILVIDLEWLGVGRVRFGFVVDGKVYYAYDALHTNTTLADVYMTTANLPLRYQIYNNGVGATSSSLKQICSSVSSEGGFDFDRAYHRGVKNTAVVSCSTSNTLVLAVRPKTSFNSITFRGQLVLDLLDIVGSADGDWILRYAPTWTGGSWSDVDATNSAAEYSLNATYTGGTVVDNGLLAGTAQSRAAINRSIATRARGLLKADGTTQLGFVIEGRALTGSINVRAAITWFELR